MSKDYTQFKQFIEENRRKPLREHQYYEMTSKLFTKLKKETDISSQLVLLGEMLMIQTQIQLYGTR